MASEHHGMTEPGLPRGFLWGATWWAYGVEGNSVQTDLWCQEHDGCSPYPEPCGDAIDHYHRWREDLALLSNLGANVVRFSLAWSRIEPEPGRFSSAALRHYRGVLEACHVLNLSPIVVLHHLDSPRWLLDAGGWQGPEMVALFHRYCARTMQALGDLTPQVVPLYGLNAADASGLLPVLPMSVPNRAGVPYWQAPSDLVAEVFESASQTIRWMCPTVQIGTSWLVSGARAQCPWPSLATSDFACLERVGNALVDSGRLATEVFDGRRRWILVDHDASRQGQLSELLDLGWPLCGWLNGAALERWDGRHGWQRGQWIEVERTRDMQRRLTAARPQRMKQQRAGKSVANPRNGLR